MQALLEFAKHFFPRPFLIMPLAKTLLRVLLGHLHEMALIAALRTKDFYFFSLSFAQIFRARFAILKLHGHENLIGDETRPLIKLGQDGCDDLFIWEFKVFQRVREVVGELSLAQQ